MVDLKKMFPHFDDDLIKHLEKIGQEVEFDEGEMLIRPGQYFKQSMLLVDGRVKVYREGENGEEFFLYYLEQGRPGPRQLSALQRMKPVRSKASQSRL